MGSEWGWWMRDRGGGSVGGGWGEGGGKQWQGILSSLEQTRTLGTEEQVGLVLGSCR